MSVKLIFTQGSAAPAGESFLGVVGTSVVVSNDGATSGQYVLADAPYTSALSTGNLGTPGTSATFTPDAPGTYPVQLRHATTNALIAALDFIVPEDSGDLVPGVTSSGDKVSPVDGSVTPGTFRPTGSPLIARGWKSVEAILRKASRLPILSAMADKALLAFDAASRTVEAVTDVGPLTSITAAGVIATAKLYLGSLGGPTLTRGTGAPTANEPDGSIYIRTHGDRSTTHYARVNGAWSPMTPAAPTPEAYGAVGDGVTDDSAELQAWLDASVTQGFECILPAKKYAFATTLIIPRGCVLRGQSKLLSELHFTGTGIALETDTTLAWRVGTIGGSLYKIVDFRLTGTPAATVGVSLPSAKALKLEIEIDGTGGAFSIACIRLWTLNATGSNCYDCRIVCWTHRGAGDGILIDADIPGAGGGLGNFIGGHSQANAGYGVRFSTTASLNNLVFIGIISEGNALGNLKIDKAIGVTGTVYLENGETGPSSSCIPLQIATTSGTSVNSITLKGVISFKNAPYGADCRNPSGTGSRAIDLSGFDFRTHTAAERAASSTGPYPPAKSCIRTSQHLGCRFGPNSCVPDTESFTPNVNATKYLDNTDGSGGVNTQTSMLSQDEGGIQIDGSLYMSATGAHGFIGFRFYPSTTEAALDRSTTGARIRFATGDGLANAFIAWALEDGTPRKILSSDSGHTIIFGDSGFTLQFKTGNGAQYLCFNTTTRFGSAGSATFFLFNGLDSAGTSSQGAIALFVRNVAPSASPTSLTTFPTGASGKGSIHADNSANPGYVLEVWEGSGWAPIVTAGPNGLQVPIVDASTVANPRSGFGAVFIDSANSNALSWKDAGGAVHVV